jgi:putrescine aminotransferase
MLGEAAGVLDQMSDQAKQPIKLEDALRMDHRQSVELHRRHLNPRLARMLGKIGADQRLVRASGPYFWDSNGVRFLDFLSGFGAVGLGYNHPSVLRAMELVEKVPVLVPGLNHLEAALAHNLAMLAPAGLERVYFANSGAEVVDASIKLARAATGRKKLLACTGAFHGRTLGALSLMDEKDFREPFEPLLPDVMHVKYGDLDAAERVLRGDDVAGFIVEPIQGEGGIRVPPPGYLPGIRDLCTLHGTLLIADEVQTGLGRTGKVFEVNRYHVTPDILVVGKMLGGGVMPLSAVLTSDAVFQAARGASRRSPFHSSTFGGNAWACAAGLASLEVLSAERLTEKAEESGAYLMCRLRELQTRHRMIADVRGHGLLIGVELAPATEGFASAVTGGVLNRLSKKFASGLVIKELYQRRHVMTAFTLNDPGVLRLEPALVVGRPEIDYMVESLDQTLASLRSFPRAVLRYARESKHHFASAGK